MFKKVLLGYIFHGSYYMDRKRGRGRKSSPAVQADPAFHNGNTGARVGCNRDQKLTKKRVEQVLPAVTPPLALPLFTTLKIRWTAK